LRFCGFTAVAGGVDPNQDEGSQELDSGFWILTSQSTSVAQANEKRCNKAFLKLLILLPE
jgi:hypothetical protein